MKIEQTNTEVDESTLNSEGLWTNALGDTVDIYALAEEMVCMDYITVTKQKGGRHPFKVDVFECPVPVEVETLEEAREHLCKEIGGWPFEEFLEGKALDGTKKQCDQLEEYCIDVMGSRLKWAWEEAQEMETEEVMKEAQEVGAPAMTT